MNNLSNRSELQVLEPIDSALGQTAGKMVAISAEDARHRSVFLLARVDNVFDHNPHEDPLSSTVSEVIPFETRYAPEGDSTVIYREAHAGILEEAVLNGDGTWGEIKAPESLARAGAWAFEADPDLVVAALGLNPVPALSLEVGAVHGSDIPATLDRSVIQRHIFIGGGIGSGKSYTRGVIAEELVRHGVPQVNIRVVPQ